MSVQQSSVAAAIVAAALALSGPARAQQPARQWCVTAMDDDHKPVTGLGKEDFSLKDGGARQPVESVEPATGPVGVSLVVWGDPPSKAISGVSDEFAASSPASRVISTAGVPSSGAAPSALEHMIERTASALGPHAEFERRAVVVIVAAPVSDGQFESPGLLIESLRTSQTPVWTVELTAPSARRTRVDDALDGAVAVGGGLRWRATSADGLIDGARGIAALLATAQYFVTADLPAIFTPPPPIATRHDRGVVLVPVWSR